MSDQMIVYGYEWVSHDEDHLEFGLPLIVLQADAFGDYRLLVGVLLGDVIQLFLEIAHLQAIMPMPEIYLEFLHMVHHLQQSLDQRLHLTMEILHFNRKESLFIVLSLIKGQYLPV